MTNRSGPRSRTRELGQALFLPLLMLMSLGCGATFPERITTVAGEPDLRLIDPEAPVTTERIVAFSSEGARLWECVAIQSRPRWNLQLTYGRVPDGFCQVVPRKGPPPQLETGEEVLVVVVDRFRAGNSGVAWLQNDGDGFRTEPVNTAEIRYALFNAVDALLEPPRRPEPP